MIDEILSLKWHSYSLGFKTCFFAGCGAYKRAVNAVVYVKSSFKCGIAVTFLKIYDVYKFGSIFVEI